MTDLKLNAGWLAGDVDVELPEASRHMLAVEDARAAAQAAREPKLPDVEAPRIMAGWQDDADAPPLSARAAISQARTDAEDRREEAQRQAAAETHAEAIAIRARIAGWEPTLGNVFARASKWSAAQDYRDAKQAMADHASGGDYPTDDEIVEKAAQRRSATEGPTAIRLRVRMDAIRAELETLDPEDPVEGQRIDKLLAELDTSAVRMSNLHVVARAAAAGSVEPTTPPVTAAPTAATRRPLVTQWPAWTAT